MVRFINVLLLLRKFRVFELCRIGAVRPIILPIIFPHPFAHLRPLLIVLLPFFPAFFSPFAIFLSVVLERARLHPLPHLFYGKAYTPKMPVIPCFHAIAPSSAYSARQSAHAFAYLPFSSPIAILEHSYLPPSFGSRNTAAACGFSPFSSSNAAYAASCI